jgi:hypothetical protein
MASIMGDLKTLSRAISHPVVLVLESIASITLWMPYGMGYYTFPWGNAPAVLLLLLFVSSFTVVATIAVVQAFFPRLRPFKAAISLLSFAIAIHGLCHMLHWWIHVVPQFDWQ